jgi:hypothetical protein
MSYPKDDFDEVRRLLACKRHEQPPPGYFNSFSARVIDHIQAEEAAGYSSWWSWLVDRLDAKPVLVCAYGLAVSGLLFLGFRLSDAFEAEVTVNPALSGPWLATTPASPISDSPQFNQTASLAAAAELLVPRPKMAFAGEPTYLLFPAGGFQLQPISYRMGNH